MRLIVLVPVWLCISVYAAPAGRFTVISKATADCRGFVEYDDTIRVDSSQSTVRDLRVYEYFYVGLVPNHWRVSGGIGLRYRWLSLDGGGVASDKLPTIAAGSPMGQFDLERYYRRTIGGDVSVWHEWDARLASYVSAGLYWEHYAELGQDRTSSRYYQIEDAERLVPGIGVGSVYDIPSGLRISGIQLHFTLGIRVHTVTGVAVTYGFGFRD